MKKRRQLKKLRPRKARWFSYKLDGADDETHGSSSMDLYTDDTGKCVIFSNKKSGN